MCSNFEVFVLSRAAALRPHPSRDSGEAPPLKLPFNRQLDHLAWKLATIEGILPYKQMRLYILIDEY